MVVSIVIKEDDIDDHYVVGRAAKTPVDIAHPVFRHLPRGKPFKIFSRNVRETDSQLQERILLSIDNLKKVCTLCAPTRLALLP